MTTTMRGFFFNYCRIFKMQTWYEDKIKEFDDKANQEMMMGDIKQFMHYQREANTYRQMLKQHTGKSN